MGVRGRVSFRGKVRVKVRVGGVQVDMERK